MADVVEQLRAALGERYEVERLVGEGGMATVYLAKDLRHGRKVAVKTLRAELAASIGADRFLREIRLAANLQHPNILGLYDSGEANGILYYVMPFVEGESLRARLDREQQLPIHDAVRITREAAEALAYAHEQGVVHRDIKPENILLQNGHALVADFGIARALDAAGEKLTQTGMAVGTPHYMSPEQAMGADAADGRSDVYSLGCVLYELLVGQPPFDGPNARAILARHTMEQVPSVTVVRPSIPDEVEDAVLQSLEKTPADRYQKMKDFADALADLESAVAVRRTTPRGVTATRRTVPRGTRSTRSGQAVQPGLTIFGLSGARLWSVVGLLFLAVGGLVAWRVWGGSAQAAGASTGGLDARRVAVLYFRNEGGDSLRYLADGLTEGLIRQLGEVQTLDVISPNGVASYRGDSIPRDSIARALNVGTLVQGTVEKAAGRITVTVRLIDGASGADYQRASIERPASDVLSVQDTLVHEVARLIRQRLGDEIKLREQRESTVSPEAWALVQRAEQSRKRGEELFAQKDTSGAAQASFDAADSTYAAAQRVDPKWVEPVLGRGWIAFRRSRLVGLDPLAAKPWIDRGKQFADRALDLEPQDPDGLQLRGELRYWSWLLTLEPDPRKADQLLNEAQSDLEAAVRVRPSQAGAWAALSHLYYQTAGETDAKLAARRAYEEDAYLANADLILQRLFQASYDLSQFVDAERWCDEGQRRFPADFKFVKCQLWLMTSKAREPDVDLAWKLADSIAKIAPRSQREFETLESRMLTAIVLARKGLADSAKVVAQRSRGGPDVDATRDLMLDDAYVRLLSGDKEGALSSLKVYFTANPDRRGAYAQDPGWWFRSLENDPGFRQLVGSQ